MTITKSSLRAATLWSRRAIALALILFLLQAPVLLAQVAGISASQAGAPMALHIVILDGENALNNIRQRTAREPVVQVQDENHKPVAGATVLFTIHAGASGAAGSFAGVATIAGVSGLDGIVTAVGLRPNTTPGTYTISVTASVGAATTSAVITQSNIIGALATTTSTAGTIAAHHVIFGSHFWIVAAGVAAAGGAIVATVVATHNTGASITPGTGTVKP